MVFDFICQIGGNDIGQAIFLKREVILQLKMPKQAQEVFYPQFDAIIQPDAAILE